MTFWNEKTVVVTGGKGFLGRYVCDLLKETECNLIILDSKDYDLTKESEIEKLFSENKIDIIIHLAASVGGIGFNQEKPGELFYNNLIMGTMLMEHARLNNVEKFVALGTVCAYPKFTSVPFKEEDLWKGYPEETNAPYGLAKKMLLVQSQAYRKQYNFNSIFLLPVNLYGPYDNFKEESSHVIPAMIKKVHDAKLSESESITLWGDGSASREFLYVEDAAKAIVLATEKYNISEPVNLGSGSEITIKKLAELICELMNYKGEIVWDSNKPNGQPRRSLDTNKAKSEFGFEACTDFKEGLRKTIEFYENSS